MQPVPLPICMSTSNENVQSMENYCFKYFPIYCLSSNTVCAKKNEASVVHFNVYNEKLNITVVAVTLHKNEGRKKSITDKHRKRRTN